MKTNESLRNNLSILFILNIIAFCNAVQVYTNHFYVNTRTEGKENAHNIAKRNGFINRGAVNKFFRFFTYFFI